MQGVSSNMNQLWNNNILLHNFCRQIVQELRYFTKFAEDLIVFAYLYVLYFTTAIFSFAVVELVSISERSACYSDICNGRKC